MARAAVRLLGVVVLVVWAGLVMAGEPSGQKAGDPDEKVKESSQAAEPGDGPGDAAGAGDSGERTFTGWAGMRVIEQSGRPRRMRVADLDADGREELIVVNTRHSRLDVYQWLPAEERAGGGRDAAARGGRGGLAGGLRGGIGGGARGGAGRPNELPMAVEFERREVPLEQLPRDVIATDLDGEAGLELVILVSSPNRVLSFGRAEDGKWRRRERWNLLPGSGSGGDRYMLLRRVGDEAKSNKGDEAGDQEASGEKAGAASAELLISFEEGIQRLRLRPEARARWLEPRERVSRAGWWLMDPDGDGDRDLVTWTRGSGRAIRWHQMCGGRLLPPQPLYDRSVGSAVGLRHASGADELLLLGGERSGLLRRYQLGRAEEAEPLGRRQALPLPGGGKAAWAGARFAGRRALVAADPDSPRLLVHGLDEEGWAPAESFPSVGSVQGVVVPPAEPGTVLLRAKDAGDLRVSRWQGDWRGGRLSYPEPMGNAPDAEDRAVLGLGRVGSTAWWVQRVGADLDLYVWPKNAKEPRKTRFAGVSEKAERAIWLGGQRLLMLEQYARSPKLVERSGGGGKAGNGDDGGKGAGDGSDRGGGGGATVHEPAHLSDAELDRFKLLETGEGRRLARLAEGVLQWLDDRLQPVDQVMLPEGQHLADYVPIPGSAGEAWALEQGGGFAHRLTPDEAGIPRLSRSIELPGGQGLRRDPVLGLMLQTGRGVMRLSEGRPIELILEQSIDGREGRPSGVKEATIHRVMTADVTGDGAEEAVLADDRRHQLTVLHRVDGELEPLISWPVFEDRRYPYGGSGGGELVTEPRTVAGADLDGDGAQDLAMLSHDRLLLYLNREAE